jgi:hypothetical protein
MKDANGNIIPEGSNYRRNPDGTYSIITEDETEKPEIKSKSDKK